MAEEQKAVREELISAYDKNIATRLKAELCTVAMDHVNNNNSYSRHTECKWQAIASVSCV